MWADMSKLVKRVVLKTALVYEQNKTWVVVCEDSRGWAVLNRDRYGRERERATSKCFRKSCFL